MKDFIKFLISKKFWINLILALTLLVACVYFALNYADSVSQKGEDSLIEIPDLTGKSIEQIEFDLDQLGLNYKVIDSVFIPTKKLGTIVEQTPKSKIKVQDSIYSNRLVKKGRTIYITLNIKTKPEKEFPNWNRVPLRELMATSEIMGFVIDSIRQVPYNECDCVIEVTYKNQVLKEHQKIPYGSHVNIKVGNRNLGKAIPVPNLMGLSLKKAKNILANNALNIRKIVLPEDNSNMNDSSLVVIKQIPVSMNNGIIYQGESVSIYLGDPARISLKSGSDSQTNPISSN